jgi:hypothetical protein
MQSRIIERSKCLPLNIRVSAAVTAAIVAETMKQFVCDVCGRPAKRKKNLWIGAARGQG